MASIHPSSVVEKGAQIAEDVVIGPMCYVGPHVKIGPGCKLIAQCHITGHTTMGNNNMVYPFVSLGCAAQDHSVVEGKISYLEIGDDNIFRENCTVHTGTLEGTKTVIGNHCMFMANSHVAHNARVGNDVIMVNGSMLAGYSEVGDRALISGLVAIHQFCRVGRLAIISGGSVFSQDVPPFMMAEGRNGGVKMPNLVGLKRAGLDEKAIGTIKKLFRIYYRSGLAPTNALAKIRTELEQTPEVIEFIEFCENSKRGVIGPRFEGKRA